VIAGPCLGIPSRMKGVVDLYGVSDGWIPIYDRSDLGGLYSRRREINPDSSFSVIG